MQVRNISSSLSFTARTHINAPESMLSKDAAEKLIKQGAKIGRPSDYIDVEVSDVFQKEDEPGVDLYSVKSDTQINGERGKAAIVLPLDKISPEGYLTRLFKQFSKW